MNALRYFQDVTGTVDLETQGFLGSRIHRGGGVASFVYLSAIQAERNRRA
jgi:hypothetical protein